MSLPLAYPNPVINLGSAAGLHAYDHEVRGYSIRYDRRAMMNLAATIRAGQGARRDRFHTMAESVRAV